MNVMQNASWITTLVISFSTYFVGAYWFWVLDVAQAKKAALLTVSGASVTLTLLLYSVIESLGPIGGLLILANWTIPSMLVWLNKKYFMQLNQYALIFIQLFRIIGGLFILEMYRGNIPASFALPAGIGDIIVAVYAAFLYFGKRKPSRSQLVTLLVLGVADFISAFFFGFTSLPGPLQLFAFGFNNQVNLFPTGMIPLFLVPIAIVFHLLSYINLPEE